MVAGARTDHREDAVMLEAVEGGFRALLRNARPPDSWPSEPVSYQRVHHDESVHVFAMTMMPGAASDIHGHGTWGLVGQMAGTETEESYGVGPGDSHGVVLERTGCRALSPGDVTRILPPGSDLHRVVNRGQVPSTTLHAFSHDLLSEGFVVYRPALYRAERYCGAWPG